MGWTAPRTWVVGETVTKAIMDAHIKDNLRYLKGLDGGATFEDDLTVDNLITAGNVDGVDVSAHKAGTAKAQHTGGAGDHTHQSSGAEGAKIDHGAALDGLTHDDHTQYALRTIMTADGDIIYRASGVWTRLAKGTAGQVLIMNAGATAPEWAAKQALIASGNYTGDDTVNKTIAHGLGIVPKIVFITAIVQVEYFFRIHGGLASIISITSAADLSYAVTAPDATNFYVGNAALYAASANSDGLTYYWTAMG